MADKERTKHPSFGTIQLNRVTSTPGTTLFNSPMRHGSYITISITRALMHRSLHEDRIHPDEELVKVCLSQHQWAEFVSSCGVGQGVPCTLSRVGGEMMPAVPEVGLRETFEKEVEAKVAGLADKVSLFHERVVVLMDKPRLVKADRDELCDLAHAIETEIGSNIPFLQSQFEKAMDKTVGVAKAEVLAHVDSVVRTVGLENLQKQGGLPTLGMVDADPPALTSDTKKVLYCQSCTTGLGRKNCPECKALTEGDKA